MSLYHEVFQGESLSEYNYFEAVRYCSSCFYGKKKHFNYYGYRFQSRVIDYRSLLNSFEYWETKSIQIQ
jgi:hypothetical protein